MIRSRRISDSLAILGLLVVVALATRGTDAGWNLEEARGVPTGPARSARPARPASDKVRWDAPRRGVVEVAGRDYLPVTRQPLGAKLALVVPSNRAARGDEPLSAWTPNGPMCSVTNPDPTGPPTICTTVSTGCNDPNALVAAR